MMSNIVLISVFIDRGLYASCVTSNPFVQNNPLINIFGIDNTIDNQCISKRYGQFLDSYDYSVPAWFVFCHSDWELREDITPLLETLDSESIYGPIGAILHKNPDSSLVREYRGQCLEKKRDGSNTRQQRCQLTNTGVLVDTLDCQCVIVHSSLVEKYSLRFDEKLNFNLYVEDFCINAKESYGIESKILNVRCCHWNQADNMIDRDDYFDDLDYCNNKYPDKLYAGIVTLIGGRSTTTMASQCENIMPQIIKVSNSPDARSTIYRVPEVVPDAPNESKSMVYRYISPNSTVLDVGCACGDLGVALRQHKSCKMHGLEYNSESVIIAQGTGAYEQVRQVDLNLLSDNQYPEYARKFDWIILGDVLEHVYNPQEVLRKMLAYIKPEGRFLISLPNLAHASIKAGLLLGDFTYTDVGLLDSTHIRFFTHKTIPAFLAKNLLKVEDYECTAANLYGFQPEDPYPHLSIPVKQAIFQDPHSFVCQYVMKVQYAPAESFASCLQANAVLHSLDESRNPFLKTYREQAISVYAPLASIGNGLFFCVLQRFGHKVGRLVYFKKIRGLLVKCVMGALLVPASFVYAGNIRDWLRGVCDGKKFFAAVLSNQGNITHKTQEQNSVFHELARKMLNRAALLKDTNSLRITFGGLRAALQGLAASTKSKGNDVPQLMGKSHSEDAVRYASYMQRFEPRTEQDFAGIAAEIHSWSETPLLSLHLHVEVGYFSQLQQTVRSVLSQLYHNWELSITFPSDLDESSRTYLKKDLSCNSRVHLIQVDGNSNLPENIALRACSGTFFISLGIGDQIPSFSLYFVAREILAHPKSHIIYSDTDVLVCGVRQKPFFKPDWNEELFLGQDYVCRLVAYKTQLLKEIEGFRKEMEPCQFYDATLRLALNSSNAQIRHIPRVLYHYGHDNFCLFTEAQREKSTLAAGSYLQNKNLIAEVCGQENGTNRVVYTMIDPLPMVSCIVAMRDKAAMTANCIRSILQDTDYANLEILLVDNGSSEAESFAFFDSLQKESRVKIIHWNRPFNYSEIQNMAVREAKGKFIALLNNDIEIKDPQWLKEMVSHSQKSHIGAVGTKLLFANDTLQHGGVILGPNGCVGHVFRDLPLDVSKQKNIAQVARWISAVTGACLVVDKQKYLEIGGLNEKDLGIAFNDVDFCIRLALAGYQNLYTPHTKIYHLESQSRGLDVDPVKKQRAETEQNYIVENYAHLLNADPFYNPNLSFYGTNYDVIATAEQSRAER